MKIGELIRAIRPTYALIDVDRLAGNLAGIRRELSPEVKLNIVVKANAYGHGSVQIARELEHLGADMLSVATVEEGLELRDRGVGLPVLVLGTVSEEQFSRAIINDLSINVYRPEKIEILNAKAGELDKRAAVHLKADTGMGRIGFRPEETASVVGALKKSEMIDIEGLFTNFARADEPDSSFTKKQLEAYNTIHGRLCEAGLAPRIRHSANTAGFINFPESRFDMIRVGIAAYGLYPAPDMRKIDIKPVMSLITHLQCIKRVPAGTPIGYGGNYITPSEKLIATIPIGYDDGIMRCLSGNLDVIVGGRRIPAVGNVSMDMTNVDVTGLADVREGDRAVVLGEDRGCGIDAVELAEKAGTLSYEIVCGIGKRVPRFYIKNGEVYAAASAYGKLLNHITHFSL